MVESVVSELLVVQELVDFVYILPNFGQIEGAEVLEETLILQILGKRAVHCRY